MIDDLKQKETGKKKQNVKVIAILAVIIVLIAMIGVIIYQLPSNRLERVLNLGNKYLETEQWEEAKIEFEKAIRIEPQCAEAYLGLAEAYVGMDDIDSAIKVLEDGYEVTHADIINQKLQELKQSLVTGDFHILGDLGGYDAYGHANEGVFIVGKDGLYGAVDYDNNVIVPLQYTNCCYGANDEGQTWFGDDNGYYVFNQNGDLIFETETPIWGVNEGVVLTCGQQGTDYIIEYTTLDQKVLYRKVIENYNGDADIIGAVELSERKAFVYVEDYSEGKVEYDKINQDGQIEDVTGIYFSQHSESEIVGDWEITTVSNGSAGWPIGAVNDGYFVSRIFDEVYITAADSGEHHNVGLGELFYYSDEGYDSWSMRGYYKNGAYVYNNGTLCCIRLDKGEKSTYILSDSWSDTNNKIGEYDYLEMNGENLWLICQDDKWGYIDKTGKVIALFDDASSFNKGTAVVIEDGMAYKIDESMNKLNEGCQAESVVCYGDIWGINKEGKTYFVQ